MLVCDHEIRIMCARKYPETAVPNGKSWRHVSPLMMFCSISCPCVPRLDSYLMRLVFNTFADIKSQFALRTLAAVGCLRPNDVRLPTSPPAGHEHRNCWIETTPRLLGQKWAPPPLWQNKVSQKLSLVKRRRWMYHPGVHQPFLASSFSFTTKGTRRELCSLPAI